MNNEDNILLLPAKYTFRSDHHMYSARNAEFNGTINPSYSSFLRKYSKNICIEFCYFSRYLELLFTWICEQVPHVPCCLMKIGFSILLGYIWLTTTVTQNNSVCVGMIIYIASSTFNDLHFTNLCFGEFFWIALFVILQLQIRSQETEWDSTISKIKYLLIIKIRWTNRE